MMAKTRQPIIPYINTRGRVAAWSVCRQNRSMASKRNSGYKRDRGGKAKTVNEENPQAIACLGFSLFGPSPFVCSFAYQYPTVSDRKPDDKWRYRVSRGRKRHPGATMRNSASNNSPAPHSILLTIFSHYLSSVIAQTPINFVSLVSSARITKKNFLKIFLILLEAFIYYVWSKRLIDW